MKWLANKKVATVLPQKRVRRTTRPDKGFCTGVELEQLDVDTSEATKYTYRKPLHMGGSRRSKRNRHNSSVARYEQEVHSIDGDIEDLLSQLRRPIQKIHGNKTVVMEEDDEMPGTINESDGDLDSGSKDHQMPDTISESDDDSDSDWDDAEEEADDDDERETQLEQICHAMRNAAVKLATRLQYNDLAPTKVWELIRMVFSLLGSPGEFSAAGDSHSCWEGQHGVINTIRDYLFLGRGWRRRRTIRRVLEHVRNQIDTGVGLSAVKVQDMKKKGQGRKRKLNAELDACVARCLNKGFGMQLTNAIINTKTTNAGKGDVHISTIYRSARATFGGTCHNRPLKKTGNKVCECECVNYLISITCSSLTHMHHRHYQDVDSIWCMARLAFALQLSQQFREDVEGESMVGKRVVRLFEDVTTGEDKPFFGVITSFDPAEQYYKVSYADGDWEELSFVQLRHPRWPKIPRLAVLWCDEKHKKVIIGPNNRHEWLFFVNPENPDAFMSAKDGGVKQTPRAATRAKYMKECRGCFGVMAKEEADGTCSGHRMEPFDYTGRKVVGPVAFEKRVQSEVRRVSALKTTGTTRSIHWKDKGEGLDGGPYEARYGDTWRQEVADRLGRGSDAVCDVTKIMDHIIEQGNILFADTPYRDTWYIYHDALSSWWSKGAQAYIETKGFRHRQIKSLDFTNTGTRYEDSLPGDTPEYMPLDSNLFSDSETMVRSNVVVTNKLPRGHPDKFDLTTPKSAWDAVCRTWRYSPTSDRIVEDINRVFCAIEEVIKARGAAVDFKTLRHGRRLEEHIRSRRRASQHSEKKCVDDLQGLHPVTKRIIIDLCNE